MRLLDDVGKLNGTEGDAEIVPGACDVQHAADGAAGKKHDLARYQIRCARRVRIDRPRETVRTHGPNGRGTTLRNDDIGLVNDLSIASGCDTVLKLGVTQRNGCGLRGYCVVRRGRRPTRATSEECCHQDEGEWSYEQHLHR